MKDSTGRLMDLVRRFEDGDTYAPADVVLIADAAREILALRKNISLAHKVLGQCHKKIDLYNQDDQRYLGGVEATRLLRNIEEIQTHICRFVALGELQGDDGLDIFLTELHRMEHGVFS